MAMTNVTLTIPAEQIYDACHEQVEASLHDRLKAEIERRWPDGLRIVVPLAVATDQPR